MGEVSPLDQYAPDDPLYRLVHQPPATAPLAHFYDRVAVDKEDPTGEIRVQAVQDYFATRLAPLGVREFTIDGNSFYRDGLDMRKTPWRMRPAACALVRNTRPGDHVIVPILFHSFRTSQETAAEVEALAKLGVYCHVLDVQIDTSTPEGRLRFDGARKLAAGTDRLRKLIRREVVSTAGMARRGVNHSERVGFRFEGKGKYRKQMPYPPELQVCRQLHEWRHQGFSWGAIARRLLRARVEWAEGQEWGIERVKRGVKVWAFYIAFGGREDISFENRHTVPNEVWEKLLNAPLRSQAVEARRRRKLRAAADSQSPQQ